MITEHFNKSFVINLNHRCDRYNAVMKEFAKHNMKVIRIPGIKGNPDSLPTIGKDGDVGCTLSHVRCIKMARDNHWKQVMVFEDDVEFRENFNELFEAYFARVPNDWDMIYLGGNHWGRDLKLIPQLTPVAENVYRTTHTLTTHAYAIRETMYDAVIEHLGKASEQVDVMYVDLQSKFKVYAFFPNLAWQRADKSDINNKECDYSFMKDRLVL